MKKLLFLFLVVATLPLTAQFVSHDYDSELFQSFLKTSKTYVLKTDDKEIDDVVAEALQKYWTVKPYEIISLDEMFEKMYNSNYSFLIPAAFSYVVTNGNVSHTTVSWQQCGRKKPEDDRHKSDPKYRSGLHWTRGGYAGFLAVFVGGPNKYEMGDMVAFAPFNVAGGFSYNDVRINGGLTNNRYRLKDMIAGINTSIIAVRDNKYKFATAQCMNFFFDKVFAQNRATIKEKTLYIPRFLFGNNQTEDLKKLYPYKYKEVDEDEYNDAVLNEKEGIAYLLLSDNTPAGIYIIDPHTHKTLAGKTMSWLNEDRKTLDAGDLKKIVDIINKE